MDDPVNGALAREGIAVVSVDYTTLPDIAFLDQIAQCHAAADWVFDNAEPAFGTRDLFIGGESAGCGWKAGSGREARGGGEALRPGSHTPGNESGARDLSGAVSCWSGVVIVGCPGCPGRLALRARR